MRRLIFAAALLLAACGRETAEQNEAAENAATTPTEAPFTPTGPVTGGGVPNENTPAAGDSRARATSAEERSPRAAAEVLERYFALINSGQRGEAAALWWQSERAEEFADRLARYQRFKANIAAPGRIEGAAGSAYVRISLQLLRNTRSGVETLSDGTAVLRRVNDVPGSTAEQRRWRIESIDLQAPPVPIAYRFIGRWATDERNCRNLAWRFTATSLRTPAGSVCNFRRVTEVPDGYDVAARCTAEGPPVGDTLKLRFAESARALLFESNSIADAGLVRCN